MCAWGPMHVQVHDLKITRKISAFSENSTRYMYVGALIELIVAGLQEQSAKLQ